MTHARARASIAFMHKEATKRQALPETALERAVGLLRGRLPSLLGIWLYGSVASGEMRSDSDVDLAFLAEASPDVWERGLFLSLADELAHLLGREVDLLDMRQASTVMRMQVVAHGRRLFCADTGRCDAFEDFVFSDYARLNEERARILADVMARGTVYG